ncbi:MAG: tRNA pseudouridine(55) synthase TruB [Gammaproteobacteria bacterium]
MTDGFEHARRHTRIAWRRVNGILLLDKPPGVSSNGALQVVRRALRAAKGGHTGNLDVAASGLLPLCFGEATKVCAYLLDSDKRYHANVRLGVVTRTGDAEGEVTASCASRPADSAEIEAVLETLRGRQLQVPPMYSALKHQGRPLYELARRGVEIERSPREISVYALELLHFDGETLTLDVRCSKGTYVRSLAVALGERLGCGAHLSGLRRLVAGPFSVDDAVPLRVFSDGLYREDALTELLRPMDSALGDLPRIELSGVELRRFGQGQCVPLPVGASPGGTVRVYETGGAFRGIGGVDPDGMLRPRRLLNVG